MKKPILNAGQCQTRVAWCSDRENWDTRWRRVVFSDEKKFNLDGPDGNRYYYHYTRKRELVHDKRHTGGVSVMVWAAIGWRGRSEIALLEGKQHLCKRRGNKRRGISNKVVVVGSGSRSSFE